MPKKPRATVADVMALVDEKHGNVSSIARALRISRQAVYRIIDKSEPLKDALSSARETMLDNVESKLYAEALAGNTTAMIFFLKTQGRSRGYQEKVELDHSGVVGFRVIEDG